MKKKQLPKKKKEDHSGKGTPGTNYVFDKGKRNGFFTRHGPGKARIRS